MAGWDHLILPTVVCYILINIPPVMFELYSYYVRGGCVVFDMSTDDTQHPQYTCNTDWWVYYKRFLDRPKSIAARAYFSYLDWSAASWDKSIYIHRRQMAKKNNEVSKWKIHIYGPFKFNWKQAHDKQWLRGDDAAAYQYPAWGNGGEQRARKEFAVAKSKGFDMYWHYQYFKNRKTPPTPEAAAASS